MRKVEGFFYGLFMDADVLLKSGMVGENPRPASVNGFALRIGNRATLVPSEGAVAYGILQSLSHQDLDKLYGASGLEAYRPEAINVVTFDQKTVPALCYNLIEAPKDSEQNADYAAALRTALTKLQFPAEYISTVR